MGIYLTLDILPHAIDPAAWSDLYEETRAFLAACPQGIVRLRRKAVGKAERIYFSRNLEREDDEAGPDDGHFWTVGGALEDLSSAETFDLYRNLDHYRRSWDGSLTAPGPNDDILTGMGTRTVFSAKTQGGGCHIPLLGAAMMIETAFPLAAVVSGDIDAETAREAQALVTAVCGRATALPVRVDAVRLLHRLSADRDAAQAMDDFDDLFLGPMDQGLRVLADAFGEAALASWYGDLMNKNEAWPTRLGGQRMITHWLNAGLSVDRLIELACVDDAGPHADPVELAEALAAAWVTAPPDAMAKVRDALPPADRPADSVDGQFASAFLDLAGASGRRCRVHVAEDALLSAFHLRFPERIDAIRAALNRRTQDTADVLASFSALLASTGPDEAKAPRPILAQAGITGLDELRPDEAEVVAALAEAMRAHLPAFRSALAKEWREFWPNRFQELASALASTHGVFLSEDAWDRLDAERDQGVLEAVIVLLFIRNDTLAFHELRRAVLESAVLCRRLADLIAQPGG